MKDMHRDLYVYAYVWAFVPFNWIEQERYDRK